MFRFSVAAFYAFTKPCFYRRRPFHHGGLQVRLLLLHFHPQLEAIVYRVSEVPHSWSATAIKTRIIRRQELFVSLVVRNRTAARHSKSNSVSWRDRYNCCPEKMIHPELLSRLCHARDLLRDWEDEPLSVIAVARASGLTHFHFIRLFKAVFGETPHQYRSRAQIERAKHLLILTDLSITDVCMAVGFSSLGSFSALFSRRAGMSPSEFQRRYRPASLPARHLPASLSPGCLSLMAGILEKEQFSRRQPVGDADTV
jgi:AraC-like DNA-binding protein